MAKLEKKLRTSPSVTRRATEGLMHTHKKEKTLVHEPQGLPEDGDVPLDEVLPQRKPRKLVGED